MNNTDRSGNSMFHFRFAVVYRPIYALGSILNLVFFFFFQYYVFDYRMNLVIFWLCFAIIYINHGRIGINTAFWGDCGWYTVSGPSNNYLEPSVLGNYLKIPRRYIRPQSPQMQYLFLNYLHRGGFFCYCSKKIWRNADITLKFCIHIHLVIMK